jgi:membrane fusion protein (multidrug efflux system)
MRADARALGLLILLAGCHHGEKETEPATPKRSVRCAPAVARSVSDAVELRGTIAPLPDRDAQVAAQVPGRILRVLVREGDAVAAGQEVARLDVAPLADEAAQAEAARDKTVAERKNAEATRARVERVFEHGIAARQEVDDAVARADAARAAEGEAGAAARRAHRQVERAVIRSPLAGVVVRVMRRPGELVDGTPSTPVLEVADPRHLELVADAPASDLVRIARGQHAAVTVAALPGATWTGVVAAVAPAVDAATGLGTVRITLDAAEGRRPPIGLLGLARVEVSAPHAAVMVPRASVRAGDAGGLEVVVCGKEGAAHVRRITRGVEVSGETEATGVSAGEEVAVDPVLGIADGDPIELAR